MNQLVSVIVPVYNHEKFIGTTIESIIAQSYENWELLIVDDCSTDGSWRIIQEYEKKDNRIRVFRNDVNKGLIPNWKFLIDESKGEYLAFLEGDDVFCKENIAKKIKKFEQFPGLGMVYCNFNVVDGEGNVLINDYRSFQKVRVYKNESISPEEYLSSKYHLINSYGQVMIRAVVIEKNGYPRTLDSSAKVFLPSDWDFNFRVARSNKIFYVDDVLFGYRRHANNNSYDAVKAYQHISLLLDEYKKMFSGDNAVLRAIQYKRSRYIYSKIIYFLELGNKCEAWNEFGSYIMALRWKSFSDINLNLRLLIRILLPNWINFRIKKIYYNQQ